jgi:ribosome maturation factor RimP
VEVQIRRWLEEIFTTEGFEDCMLIDLVFSGEKKVEVFLDADSGLTFKKCQRISRLLEAHIDEANLLGEKYVLEVSSPGAKRPMKFLRQFPKHIGRELKVKLKDGTVMIGKLSNVENSNIILEIIKKEKKKKEIKQVTVAFEEIESAIVTFKF